MDVTPVFITCRDRVRDLRNLVAWLEKAGHQRIVLLDNDSTYEPLLAYLGESPHEVVYLRENLGPRALWAAERVPDEPFVVTDPDVVPTEECPLDAVAHLAELLERYRGYPKAGLGLYLDDVPDYFPHSTWERSLMSRPIAPGVYDSMIDTTFALYRPDAPWADPGHLAIRCGAPYLARHGSWYVIEPDAEDQFYLDRATPGPNGSSWKETM